MAFSNKPRIHQDKFVQFPTYPVETPSSPNPHGAGAGAVGRSSRTLGQVIIECVAVTLDGLSDTVKFEAKKMKEGGRKKIFKKKFEVGEGEKLLKASSCCLSTEACDIKGLLFISNKRIAFCSMRSIIIPNTQHNAAVDQIQVPLGNIDSNKLDNPQQEKIIIRTKDDSQYRFTNFKRYKKARQNFEKALENCQAR